MGDITVLGPTSAPFPFEFPSAVVSVKEDWEDDWVPEPRFQNVSFYTHVGSIGPGMASLPISYGQIMYQWETSFSEITPHKYRNWWVKIELATDEELVNQWVGRIVDEQRALLGSSDGQTGDQLWRAYSALYELDAIALSTSYWNEDNATPVVMDWIPPMNQRTADGRIVGNRSAEKDGTNEVFMYGGTDEWTRKEYIEYLLKMYAEQEDGPEWELTGQTDSLEKMKDVVEFRETQTVMEAIQQLITPRMGIDFVVNPTEDGFEVKVFPLQDEEVEFGDTTLAANTDVLRIQVGQTKDLIKAMVEKSSGTTHNKIRLIGERIIVVSSIYGEDLVLDADDAMQPGWDTDTLQTEYLEATGSDAWRSAANDRLRNDIKYNDVYRKYIAHEDWSRPVPIMNSDGTLPENKDIELDTAQTILRNTLNWLPLYESYDYSTEPPGALNDQIVEPEFMEPRVWFYAPTATVAGFTISGGYFPITSIATVHALANDWGVYLGCESGLILAGGHNTGQNISSYTARYDYNKFVYTLAVNADHRMTLEYDLGNDDGTVYELYVPGAELWLMAPKTAVGATTYDATNGNQLLYSKDQWIELRNDASRLAPLMAGLIARFQNDRARGSFVVEGYRPWAGLAGKILQTVEDAGDTYDIKGVITSVSWSNHRTAIKTGYR